MAAVRAQEPEAKLVAFLLGNRARREGGKCWRWVWKTFAECCAQPQKDDYNLYWLSSDTDVPECFAGAWAGTVAPQGGSGGSDSAARPAVFTFVVIAIIAELLTASQ